MMIQIPKDMYKMKPKPIFFILITAVLLAACGSSATPTPVVDVNAMNTAIVGTTVAQLSGQFTQTALAAPTNTPAPTETQSTVPTAALPTLANGPTATLNPAALPTFSFVNTPVAGNTLAAGVTPLVTPISNNSGQVGTAFGCNDGLFIGENLPDGSVIKTGADFAKSWEIKNTGTCTWDEGYTFAFLRDVSSSGIKGYDIVIKAADEFTKPGHSQSFIIKLTAPTTAGEYKGYWRMQDDSGNYFGPRVYFDIVVK